MWSALPPAQQARVSAVAFAQCRRDQAQQVGATRIVYQRTISQRDTARPTPGNAHTPGVVVTGQLYFDSRDPVTQRITLFWYPDGSDWRWLLDDASLRTYERGSCPS